MTQDDTGQTQPRAGAGQAAAQGGPSGLLANGSALFGSRLVVAALGWAGTLLVVRALDTDTFGQFAFVFSLIGLLSFATDFSSSRIVVRALAMPGADRESLAGTYVVLRGLLGLAPYVLAVVFVVVAGYPSDVVLATVVAGLGLIVGSSGGGLDAVFQAEVRMGHVALGDVAGQIAQLALTVIIALTAPGLLLFVVPALLFDIVAVAWKAVFVRRIVRVRLSVQVRTWASLQRQAAPLAAATALFAISQQVPVVLLSQLDVFAAVGLFAIAVKFVTLVHFVPSALAAPLLPLLVRSWPHDRERFQRTVGRALLLLTVAGGAIAVGFVPVAADVIGLLYGEDYRAAGGAAALVVAATCTTFATDVAIVVLITVGAARTYILLGLLRLVVTVVLTLVLVPSMSYDGAAVASAAGTVVVTIAVAVLARRHGGLTGLPVWRCIGVLLVAAVATGVGAAVAQVAPWPVASAAGLVVYLALVEPTRLSGPGGLRSLMTDRAHE